MSVCILDLVFRHAKHMHLYFIVISGLFGSTKHLTLCHKRNDFRKYIVKHKMGVVIFAKTFV